MRAFLIACACLIAFPAMAWDLDQVRERAENNLVQVGDGCSGTIVSVEHRLVITAYHCITSAIRVKQEPRTDKDGEVIVGPDGKQRTAVVKTLRQVPLHQFFWDEEGKKGELAYFADIVARNEKKDVAILQIPERVGPVNVSIAATSDVPLLPKDDKVMLGSTVWHIGNPMMLYGTVTKGIMSSPRSMEDFGIDGNKFYVQYDGGIFGGSSGGAIYDDEGVYLGVVSMVAPRATFIGLAVPMSDVWEVAAEACIADKLGGENAARCKYVAKKPGQP